MTAHPRELALPFWLWLAVGAVVGVLGSVGAAAAWLYRAYPGWHS